MSARTEKAERHGRDCSLRRKSTPWSKPFISAAMAKAARPRAPPPTTSICTRSIAPITMPWPPRRRISDCARHSVLCSWSPAGLLRRTFGRANERSRPAAPDRRGPRHQSSLLHARGTGRSARSSRWCARLFDLIRFRNAHPAFSGDFQVRSSDDTFHFDGVAPGFRLGPARRRSRGSMCGRFPIPIQRAIKR